MPPHVPGMSPPSSYEELPQQSIMRQVLATPWLILVLMLSSLFLFTMMALTVWGDRGLLAMWRTQHDLDRLGREIEIIDQKNASLVRDMQRLRTDRDYVEKIAREELGLVRAGEIMFEFPD